MGFDPRKDKLRKFLAGTLPWLVRLVFPLETSICWKTQWLLATIRRQMGRSINRLNIPSSSQAFRSQGWFICRRIKANRLALDWVLLFCKHAWMPLEMTYSGAISTLQNGYLAITGFSFQSKAHSGLHLYYWLILLPEGSWHRGDGEWIQFSCFLTFVLVEDEKSRPILYHIVFKTLLFHLVPSQTLSGERNNMLLIP